MEQDWDRAPCLNVLRDGLGDPKYRPCPLLRRMVAAGQLGRKSGHGFYVYASALSSPAADGTMGPPPGAVGTRRDRERGRRYRRR